MTSEHGVQVDLAYTLRRSQNLVVEVNQELTHSSNVGKANHNVPPRKMVLITKTAAIFIPAFSKSFLEDTLLDGEGSTAP